MIRAVAWDIDGTLIDSEPLHHRALMLVSERYGVPIAVGDQRFVGVAMDDVWRVLKPLYPGDLTKPAWLEAICASYFVESGGLKAMPGALAAMAQLHQAGIRQCCVSNSLRRIVDINLAALGVGAWVEFSISRDDVALGKPDPAPYALACRRLGLPPSNVLAVEDSATGLLAARAAGCHVLHAHAPWEDLFQQVRDTARGRVNAVSP